MARAMRSSLRSLRSFGVALVALVAFVFVPVALAEAKPLGRRIIHPEWNPRDGRPVKVAFFDADSTLRLSKSGSPSANGARDVRLLPGVARRIKRLNRRGFLVAIASNQGGAGTRVSLEDADAALAYTGALIARRGARVDYYDFAEHPDGDRKPGIGMAERLEMMLASRHGLTIDKARSFMVGDAGWRRAGRNGPADVRPDGRPGTDFSNADRLFAERYGVRFFHAPGYFVGRRKD
jgi:DNA 3'-phosphatase